MRYTITVSRRDPSTDAAARGVRSDMHELGVTGVERVEIDLVYRLNGSIGQADAEQIASTLLADPIVHSYMSSRTSVPICPMTAMLSRLRTIRA